MPTSTGLMVPTAVTEGARQFGPLRVVAQVALGRRSSILLTKSVVDRELWLVKELHRGEDPRRFAKELERGNALASAPPYAPASQNEGTTWAQRRPIFGESLSTVLERVLSSGRPIAPRIVFGLGHAIAQLIPPASESRVHGDLVPHHVVIGFDGQVHLIDPAGAEDADERAAIADRTGYRSPEHVQGRPLTPASDVFVLGVLLFELSTGQRLYPSPERAISDEAIGAGSHPKPRTLIGESYPMELQVVLRKMLKAERGGRYTDGPRAQEGLRMAAENYGTATQAEVGAWLRSALRDRFEGWVKLLGDLGNTWSAEHNSIPPPELSRTERISRAPKPVAAAAQKVLTLEELERADEEGRTLFHSTELAFGASMLAEETRTDSATANEVTEVGVDPRAQQTDFTTVDEIGENTEEHYLQNFGEQSEPGAEPARSSVPPPVDLTSDLVEGKSGRRRAEPALTAPARMTPLMSVTEEVTSPGEQRTPPPSLSGQTERSAAPELSPQTLTHAIPLPPSGLPRGRFPRASDATEIAVRPPSAPKTAPKHEVTEPAAHLPPRQTFETEAIPLPPSGGRRPAAAKEPAKDVLPVLPPAPQNEGARPSAREQIPASALQTRPALAETPVKRNIDRTPRRRPEAEGDGRLRVTPRRPIAGDDTLVVRERGETEGASLSTDQLVIPVADEEVQRSSRSRKALVGAIVVLLLAGAVLAASFFAKTGATERTRSAETQAP